MALPTSGTITAAMINTELGRAANAAFNLNDSAVRALAGRPSGAISFSDFYGKAAETVLYAPSNSFATNIADIFNNAEAGLWASTTKKKRLIVNQAVGPLVINSAFGAGLTIEVTSAGSINGFGGAANSGVGGNALNITTATGITLINNGVIRGGGGGGGKGGNGGTGTFNISERVPPSGDYPYGTAAGQAMWTVLSSSELRWDGALLAGSFGTGVTQITVGEWTYHRSTLVATLPPGTLPNQPFPAFRYAVFRTRTITTTSSGGAGGNGGRGQGWDGAAAAGANGAAGGTNAGAGGKGGNGGAYGNAGATGATGASGNAGAGAAGTAGGAAGKAINGYNRVSYSGSGSLLGGTANT